MPEFSITFCCAHVHTMVKYVVLWYAVEISLSFFFLRAFLFKKYTLCLFLCAWRHLWTAVIKKLDIFNIFLHHLFLHQIIESSMDNCIDKYRISIDKM